MHADRLFAGFVLFLGDFLGGLCRLYGLGWLSSLGCFLLVERALYAHGLTAGIIAAFLTSNVGKDRGLAFAASGQGLRLHSKV